MRATDALPALPFWEFNPRFKTDSSDKGPRPAQPVLLPASMMGDRAFVTFAARERLFTQPGALPMTSAAGWRIDAEPSIDAGARSEASRRGGRS